MSEQRDLRADLEICEKATPGPWTPTYGNEFVAQDKYDEDDCRQGICRLLHKPKRKEDSEFIAAAREGWPESIRRAIEAEEILALQSDDLISTQLERNEAMKQAAALREENDQQRHGIQQLSAQVAGLQAVAEAANLILFWRGISETDDKKASDDWVKFLQDNGYWDRYDGCCNCSLCTKAREEYKKSVEKRLYEAVKAYREISQPDPGAEIMERMKKLEAVAEAAKEVCMECRAEAISEGWDTVCEEGRECYFQFVMRALAALEGDAHE